MRTRVALFRGSRNGWASRIGQTEHIGDLIKRFASRIINRAAQRLKVDGGLAMIEAGVSATDNEPDARKDLAATGDPTRINMRVQMVDGYQRLAGRQT